MSDIKTNRKRAGLMLSAALLLASAGARAASEENAALEAQRKEFLTYCASCHGPEGRGDGPVANELKKRPADLTQLAKKNNGVFPYARARAVIDGRGQSVGIHGPAEMPVWGERFARETESNVRARAKILDIVDYLASIQE